MFAAKVAVAVIAIGTLALVAGGQVVPGLAAWNVLAGAALLAALLFAVALAYLVVAGSVKQWLLRKGAIDVGWLWAPDYPEGFKRYWRRGAEGESGGP